jgi:hypothetical protein
MPMLSNQDTTRDSVSASNFDFALPKDITSLIKQQQQQQNQAAESTLQLASQNNVLSTKPSNAKLQNSSPKSKVFNHNISSSNNKSKKDSELLTEHDLELLRIGDDTDMERILNRSSGKQERKNSLSLKAMTGPIHALWTQKVIDYQNNLPSVKKRENLVEIRNQFDNVMDEKTIDIHKKLEQILKYFIKKNNDK